MESMDSLQIRDLAQNLTENIDKVIMGKDDIIQKIIISMLCKGHILLEDIPGTGKTTLAKALAKSIDCDFKRVQFTPDLLPSDLTGINFFSQKTSEFVLKKGPVFTNILLCDEINRATPRTQSSLLECMEEGQVSIDGVTYMLDSPFLVIATQNPIETQGTFPLPEAQLDRFFMKLSMGYPDLSSQLSMLGAYMDISPLVDLSTVITVDEIINAQAYIRTVPVNNAVLNYILALVENTRKNDQVRLGVSPRGAIAIMHAAQAHAAVNGQNYVTPDDVKAIFYDLASHRIICKGHHIAGADNAASEIISQILSQTPVPTEDI